MKNNKLSAFGSAFGYLIPAFFRLQNRLQNQFSLKITSSNNL
jgi:hypothetical protein